MSVGKRITRYLVIMLLFAAVAFALSVQMAYAATEINIQETDGDKSGEGWIYESSTHTLTLYGYEGSGVTIGAEDVAIIVRSKNTTKYIKADGDLDISGSGTLVLNTSSTADVLCGISAQGDITIKDVNINNTSSAKASGINAGGDLKITGKSNIDITNNKVDSPVAGVRASGDVFMGTSGDVSIKSDGGGIDASGEIVVKNTGTTNIQYNNNYQYIGTGIRAGKNVIIDGVPSLEVYGLYTGISANGNTDDGCMPKIQISNSSNVSISAYSGLFSDYGVDVLDSEVDVNIIDAAAGVGNSAEHGLMIKGNSEVTIYSQNSSGSSPLVSPAAVQNVIDLDGGNVHFGCKKPKSIKVSLGKNTFLLNRDKYGVSTSQPEGIINLSESTNFSANIVFSEDADNLVPVLSDDVLPDGYVDEFYNHAIETKGLPGITWCISDGALPKGISLDESTGEIKGTPEMAGEFTFTITASNGEGSSSQSYTITISHPKNSVPEASFMATGVDCGILKGLTTKMKYSLDGGTVWRDVNAKEIDLSGVTEDNGIKIYQPGDSMSSDSPVQIIELQKARIPSECTATNCITCDNNDGFISGITEDMEYKVSEDGAWIPGTGKELTGLPPGKYYVRVKAQGTRLASETLELTISEHAHIFSSWSVIVDSDCTNEGAEERACSVCGEREERSVPPKGHKWVQINYIWSSDYSSVTATAVCEASSEHQTFETVNTTSKITKPATYTALGERTYTATFSNNAFSPQEKVVVNVPKLAKKAQPMVAKGKTVKIQYSKLKKKAQTISAKNAYSISRQQGKVTYKKISGNAKITVASLGKITVKKGLKKGTYKVKVRVKASGNTIYKLGSKSAVVTIKIK